MNCTAPFMDEFIISEEKSSQDEVDFMGRDLICPSETDWIVKSAVYMTDGLKRGLGNVTLKGV